VAEGGTAGPATSHMVVSARSESPFGPWDNSPINPVIRTKKDSEKWWSLGHGTPFADATGNWWIVFHGYEKGHYNMGRQTLLLPLEWTDDGWYKIASGIKIDGHIKKPAVRSSGTTFSLSDNFVGKELKPQWKFFAEYDTSRFHLIDNSLIINAKGRSVGESAPLLTIPSDHSYSAQVELRIEDEAIGGLVLFYNDRAYSGILADKGNILANLRGWQFPTEKNVIQNHVYLRLINRDNTFNLILYWQQLN